MSSEKEGLVTAPGARYGTPPPDYTEHQNGTPNPAFASPVPASATAPAPAPPSVMSPPPPSTSVGWTLQHTEYWTVRTNAGVVAHPGNSPPPRSKSLVEAYLLWMPLGLLGAHHFYLGRPAFGVTYFLSFGLLGVGWLVDLFRMPCLVSSVNKANRTRYEQLQQLQQHLRQQRLQQEQQYGTAAASLNDVTFLPFKPYSLVDAYIMWFPCGLFGYHHFYLGNYGMGFLYHVTLGLLGIGWLIDLFRMPSLVREANDRRFQDRPKTYSQCTAHTMALSPAGVLGGHHFYLNRPLWGFLYLSTFGLLGLGWLYDWFRVHRLVKRANAVQRRELSPNRKFLDDAYILCFPLGFTGLHHFYLRRPVWGVLYFLTLGIFGLGWIIDWFRLPFLVRDCNANWEQSQKLVSAGSGAGTGKGVTVVTSSVTFNPDQASPPAAPAAYPPGAGYGYHQPPYPRAPHPAPPAYPPESPACMGQGIAPPSYQVSVKEDHRPDTKY